jgi:hypothetical protein
VSCFFQIGEDDVWNPANLVARTFHAEVLALEKVFEVPSGLGPITDDECRIDNRDFTPFVATLLREYQKTNHTVLRSLLEGVIGVGLVLLERAGGSDIPSLKNPGEFWEERRRSLSRRMTRG